MSERARAGARRVRRGLSLAGLVLLVAAFALTGPAGPASAAGNGVIEGQVKNGTADGPTPAGLTVVLHAVQPDNSITRQQTTTDAQGHYRFEGLDTSSGVKYLPVVDYQEAAYFPQPISFGDQTVQNGDITVYEPTTSDQWIAFERTNLLIQGISPGRLDVMEMGSLANVGDRTYVGPDVADGQDRPTLVLPLPSGATEVAPRAGFAPSDFTVVGGSVQISSPILPGRHQIALSYSLPYSGDSLLVAKRLSYPALGFTLYVPDVGLQVASPQLQQPSQSDLGGQKYLLYGTQNLPRGGEVQIQLRGLPASGLLAPEQLAWPVLGAGLVVLLAGLVVAYRRRAAPRRAEAVAATNGSLARASDDDLDDLERMRLLLALARLDERHERGELSDDQYEAERGARKRRLVALDRTRLGAAAGGE